VSNQKKSKYEKKSKIWLKILKYFLAIVLATSIILAYVCDNVAIFNYGVIICIVVFLLGGILYKRN